MLCGADENYPQNDAMAVEALRITTKDSTSGVLCGAGITITIIEASYYTIIIGYYYYVIYYLLYCGVYYYYYLIITKNPDNPENYPPRKCKCMHPLASILALTRRMLINRRITITNCSAAGCCRRKLCDHMRNASEAWNLRHYSCATSPEHKHGRGIPIWSGHEGKAVLRRSFH